MVRNQFILVLIRRFLLLFPPGTKSTSLLSSSSSSQSSSISESASHFLLFLRGLGCDVVADDDEASIDAVVVEPLLAAVSFNRISRFGESFEIIIELWAPMLTYHFLLFLICDSWYIQMALDNMSSI
ncbi:hypothetical protein FRC20_009878 [Serendipita sp. 405]|nr:hypothetical protein FRC20_009878 [Serendipita sp. 405]